MDQELQQLETLYNTLTEFAVTYSFQILGAIFIVAIGAWIAAKVGRFVENLMVGRDIDVTLSRFTGATCKTVVLVLIFIIALGQIGISVTPVVAAIGALGLGAGLAIQGMLSNYAAGFTIILTRPFVVNDTIKVQGVAGLVAEVHLGYTILLDEDNVRIQIPNRLIVGEILHNSASNILVELSIGVAYHSDTDQVIEVIRNAVVGLDDLESGRAPLVGIDSFGDSSIIVGIRFWAPTDKHYQVKYQANKAIHDALKAASVEIPFPQREVRMLPAD